MILVTGATGLVGSHLLVKLLQENHEVKALYRKTSNLEAVKNVFKYYNYEGLFEKIHWIEGDIIDIPSLNIAFENIVQVYHCAALISFDPNDEEKLRKINIEGTANIVNCCLDFGVKKLCHVSSIAALGDAKEHETSINEETEWNPEKLHGDYAITKYGAEMEVWRGMQEGLEVIIVNPGVIFGYGFPNNGSGVLINKIKNGLLFYTKGKTGIIAVEDVVNCMCQLMKSTISGERYILVAKNVFLDDLIFQIADALNVKRPKYYAKKWMTSMGWKLDFIFNKLLNKKRSFTKSIATSSHTQIDFDNSKILSTSLNIKFREMEKYLQNSSILIAIQH